MVKKQYAFTLLELLVSISAFFILFFITVSFTGISDTCFLRQEQDLLASVIVYMQQKALISHKKQVLFCDSNAHSYHFTYPRDKQVAYPLKRGVVFGFLLGAQGPPGSTHKEPITQAITFEGNNHQRGVISFYPDGKISAGTIYLLNKKRQKMVALTVGINDFSVVRKYEYRSGSWKNL